MPSLLILIITLAAVTAINAIVAAWLHIRHQLDGVLYWCAGAAFVSAGVLSLTFRDSLPEMPGHILSHLSILLGYFLAWLGMRRFVGKKLEPLYLSIGIFLVVVSSCGYVFWAQVWPDFGLRFKFTSFGVAIFSLLIANSLVASNRRNKCTILTGAAFAFYGLVAVVRSASTFLSPSMQPIMSSGSALAGYFAFSILFSLVATLGECCMVYQEVKAPAID